MKINLQLLTAFILTAIIGSFCIEGMRNLSAHHLNYQGRYFKGYGTFLFESPHVDDEIIKVKYLNPNVDYKNLGGWKAIMKRDAKNKAVIDGSGLLLALICLIVGTILLIINRMSHQCMTRFNWFGFFLSLFYFRYVVHYGYAIYAQSIFCNETNLILNLPLPIFTTLYIFVFVGLLIGVVLVFQLPKALQLKTILIGALGGIIGLYGWMRLGAIIFT